MNDVLSNDQVAALVEAAKQGQPRPRDGRRRKRRARRVRDIDFSRPSKFAQDQQRRLERAHESFCRTAATRLSAELLTEVELEVLGVDQLTWSTAISQIPQPSICAIDRVPAARHAGPDDRRAGAGAPPGRAAAGRRRGHRQGAPRELTEIEIALVRRVFDTLLEQLSSTWAELAGVTPRPSGLESQIANVNLAPPSEPTLMLTIEVKIDGSSSTMSLVLPAPGRRAGARRTCRAASTARSQIDADVAGGRAHAGSRPSTSRSAPRSRRRHMPVDEVLALKPGDVLRFRRAGGERRHALRRPRARPPRPAGPQRQLARGAGHRTGWRWRS